MGKIIVSSLSLLFIVFSICNDSEGNDIPNNIKFIEAHNKKVNLVIDLDENKIKIKRLEIDREMPLGVLNLKLKEEYIVTIANRSLSNNGKITITGSDYYDGIGTDIKISFFKDSSKATIFIESHYEDLAIKYIPQRVPITIIRR